MVRKHALVFPGDEKELVYLHRETIAIPALRVAALWFIFSIASQPTNEQVFRESLIAAKALHAPLIRIWAGAVPSAAADSDYHVRLAKEAQTYR